MTEYWRSWSRLPNPSRCNLLQLQPEPGQLAGFFYAHKASRVNLARRALADVVQALRRGWFPRCFTWPRWPLSNTR
jgi:hypothetical protein